MKKSFKDDFDGYEDDDNDYVFFINVVYND